MATNYKTLPAADGQAQTNEPPPMPCMVCKSMASWKSLSMLGGRCSMCYESYLRQTEPAPFTGDKRVKGPKAWAYALRDREKSGERLSKAQKDMWRAAIGAEA